MSVTISPNSNQIRSVGQGITFTATASGFATGVSWAWFKDGLQLVGQSANTFTISSANMDSNGSYYARATPMFGQSANSLSVTLKVVPTITTTKTNLLTNQGLTLTATPATFMNNVTQWKWYKTGSSTPLATTTTGTYQVTSVTTANTGTYYVSVTRFGVEYFSSENSNSVTITVYPLPTVTPTAATRIIGQNNIVLTCNPPTGLTGALTYQWRKDGLTIAGATNNTYSVITNTSSESIYSVVFNSSIAGTPAVTSTNSVITINPKPNITGSTTATVNSSVTLTCNATTQGTPTFAWYKVGESGAIAGATSSTYTYTPSATGSDVFYVIVSDDNGAATQSDNFTVTVSAGPVGTPAAPTLLSTGLDTISVSWSAVALNGNNTVTYTVYYGTGSDEFAPWSTTTTSTSLTLSGLAAETTYGVYVSAAGDLDTTNMGSSSTFEFASTWSLPYVSITGISSTQIIMDTPVTLSASITNPIVGQTPVYQWYKGTATINDAINPTYSIDTTSTIGSGNYSVQVSYVETSIAVTSDIVSITIIDKPILSLSSSTIPINGTATFTLSNMTTNYTYFLYKDEILIGNMYGGNTKYIFFDNVDPANAYQTITTNTIGTANYKVSVIQGTTNNIFNPAVGIIGFSATVTLTTRALSSNTTLSILQVNDESMFNTAAFFTTNSSVNVIANAIDSNATVVIAGNTTTLNEGSNPVTVTVTAEDGTTTTTYSFIIRRLAPITINSISITPYNVATVNSSITLTANTSAPTAGETFTYQWYLNNELIDDNLQFSSRTLTVPSSPGGYNYKVSVFYNGTLIGTTSAPVAVSVIPLAPAISGITVSEIAGSYIKQPPPATSTVMMQFSFTPVQGAASYKLLDGTNSEIELLTSPVTPGNIVPFKYTATAFTTLSYYVVAYDSNGNQLTERQSQALSEPIACLPRGTPVLTPSGYRLVEDFADGDLVVTDDGREVPVKVHRSGTTCSDAKSAPVRIAARSFFGAYPVAPIRVSSWHAFKVGSGNQWLLPKDVIGLDGVIQEPFGQAVEYYHFELPDYLRDNLVIEGGAVVESYGIPWKKAAGLWGKPTYIKNEATGNFERITGV